MKTNKINLLLAAEFSNPPSPKKSLTPEYFIGRIKNILKKITEFGNFKGVQIISDRQVGKLFMHRTYVLNYGAHQIEFSLLHFLPAGRWEVNGFRLI